MTTYDASAPDLADLLEPIDHRGPVLESGIRPVASHLRQAGDGWDDEATRVYQPGGSDVGSVFEAAQTHTPSIPPVHTPIIVYPVRPSGARAARRASVPPPVPEQPRPRASASIAPDLGVVTTPSTPVMAAAAAPHAVPAPAPLPLPPGAPVATTVPAASWLPPVTPSTPSYLPLATPSRPAPAGGRTASLLAALVLTGGAIVAVLVWVLAQRSQVPTALSQAPLAALQAAGASSGVVQAAPAPVVPSGELPLAPGQPGPSVAAEAVAADGATVELAETAPPVLDGQPTAPATGRLSGAAGSRVAQPTPVEPAVPVAVAPPREEARLDEGQIRAALALPADLEPLDVPRSAAPVQPAPRVAAATPRVAAPAPTAATALPAAAPPAAAPAPSAPAAATSRPASSASMGTLNVTSDPPSVVYIDGQLRGYTPLSGVSLPPGRHRVLLVNPERPIRRTIWVDIEAGQVLTRAANLHHD